MSLTEAEASAVRMNEAGETPNAVTVNAAEHQPPWDLEITPHARLLSLPVSEVWRYRDLLFLFVRRDFVAFYKQTILGPIWFFIQPLFTTLIYVFVFGNVAGLSTDDVPKPLFYLAGITLWNYFAECLTKTSETFTVNANLFGKVYFPRLIMPFSIVISNLLRLGIQLGLFGVALAYYASHGYFRVQWSALLLPYFVLLLATMSLGIGLIFSSLTTKYRDLKFLLQFGVQLMMYASPVIYPMSLVAGSQRGAVLLWNPLAPILEGFRHGFLGAGQMSLAGLVWSTVFAISVLLLGTVIFNRTERTFIDTV